MLTVVEQPPQFCPAPKNRPIRWVIQTDEHITSPGSPAFFTVRIDTTGGPDGEPLILAGQTFTTDDNVPFTFNTFDPNGSSQVVAQNLADAILANEYFSNFQVWLSSSGGGAIWTVNVFDFDNNLYQDWDFDDTGLSILAVTIANTNGTAPSIANMRLWFRLYRGDLAITKRRHKDLAFDSNLPFFTEVEIQVNEIVRDLVSSTIPGLTATNLPVVDFGWSEQIQLRFGLISLDDNCNEVPGSGSSTGLVTICNSIFQLEHTRNMQDYCPNLAGVSKFLSNRPTSMQICSGTHEWIWIWIEETPIWLAPFRAVYTFYSGESVIGDFNRSISTTNEANIIPIGWALDFIPSNATHYEMKIQGQILDEADTPQWTDYSEVITRTKVSCNCKAAEIYFLEDYGSYRTVTFEKLTARTSNTTEVTYELPITFTGEYQNTKYFEEGGIYSEAEKAHDTFTLETEVLRTLEDRRTYEQLLRSPRAYIKTMNQRGELIMRRIIFPKTSFTTFQEAAAVRLQIQFRFSTDVQVH